MEVSGVSVVKFFEQNAHEFGQQHLGGNKNTKKKKRHTTITVIKGGWKTFTTPNPFFHYASYHWQCFDRFPCCCGHTREGLSRET